MKSIARNAAFVALVAASAVTATSSTMDPNPIVNCVAGCAPEDVKCRADCVTAAAPSQDAPINTYNCIRDNCIKIANNPTKAAACNTDCINTYFLKKDGATVQDYSQYETAPDQPYMHTSYQDAYNSKSSTSSNTMDPNPIVNCVANCDAADVKCRADCVTAAAPSQDAPINTYNCIRDHCLKIADNPTKAAECNTDCIDTYFLKKAGATVHDYSQYETAQDQPYMHTSYQEACKANSSGKSSDSGSKGYVSSSASSAGYAATSTANAYKAAPTDSYAGDAAKNNNNAKTAYSTSDAAGTIASALSAVVAGVVSFTALFL